jgi:hypothetical protein
MDHDLKDFLKLHARTSMNPRSALRPRAAYALGAWQSDDGKLPRGRVL